MRKLRVTIEGKAYEVTVEDLDERASPNRALAGAGLATSTVTAPIVEAKKPAAAVSSDGATLSPMAGSIVDVKVKNGESVKAGQVVVVLEAMKMECLINSPGDGVIQGLSVSAGESVQEGQPLFNLES